jgi:hypothetical protein
MVLLKYAYYSLKVHSHEIFDIRFFLPAPLVHIQIRLEHKTYFAEISKFEARCVYMPSIQNNFCQARAK